MNQHTTVSSITSLDHIFHDLNLVRSINPIIHNVTNFVVMQTTANVLLAVGASPIMAHAIDEIAEVIALANALVINIGTLDGTWAQAIQHAQLAALKRNIPVVFDPVGAGATRYRTEMAKKILNTGVTVLRGNASEIMALADSTIKIRGLCADHNGVNAIDAAKLLAQQYHCIVVATGKTDLVTDGKKTILLTHGTPLFTRVTGMGCSSTALIAAFAAANQNNLLAAIHAMLVFTLAGELAEKSAHGPASFYDGLLDNLFSMQPSELNTPLKIYE